MSKQTALTISFALTTVVATGAAVFLAIERNNDVQVPKTSKVCISARTSGIVFGDIDDTTISECISRLELEGYEIVETRPLPDNKFEDSRVLVRGEKFKS